MHYRATYISTPACAVHGLWPWHGSSCMHGNMQCSTYCIQKFLSMGWLGWQCIKPTCLGLWACKHTIKWICATGWLCSKACKWFYGRRLPGGKGNTSFHFMGLLCSNYIKRIHYRQWEVRQGIKPFHFMQWLARNTAKQKNVLQHVTTVRPYPP